MENEMQNNYNDQAVSQPSSVGSWFVAILLTCIPIVNLVMLCVWGFGNTEDVSKKNWAKAQLIFVVISFVLSIVSMAMFGAAIASIFTLD